MVPQKETISSGFESICHLNVTNNRKMKDNKNKFYRFQAPNPDNQDE